MLSIHAQHLTRSNIHSNIHTHLQMHTLKAHIHIYLYIPHIHSGTYTDSHKCTHTYTMHTFKHMCAHYVHIFKHTCIHYMHEIKHACTHYVHIFKHICCSLQGLVRENRQIDYVWFECVHSIIAASLD